MHMTLDGNKLAGASLVFETCGASDRSSTVSSCRSCTDFFFLDSASLNGKDHANDSFFRQIMYGRLVSCLSHQLSGCLDLDKQKLRFLEVIQVLFSFPWIAEPTKTRYAKYSIWITTLRLALVCGREVEIHLVSEEMAAQG